MLAIRDRGVRVLADSVGWSTPMDFMMDREEAKCECARLILSWKSRLDRGVLSDFKKSLKAARLLDSDTTCRVRGSRSAKSFRKFILF